MFLQEIYLDEFDCLDGLVACYGLSYPLELIHSELAFLHDKDLDGGIGLNTIGEHLGAPIIQVDSLDSQLGDDAVGTAQLFLD